ncbi:MAG: MFS transporter, partial [Pseudomonas sp.]|nr:MFS transporter [Pseudomonas sp.]
IGNLFARLGSGALPFLTPLLLQLAMGYSPAQAGMSLIPLALAAMAAKPLARPLIERLGYRNILTSNTLLLGALIASLALVDAQTSTLQLIIQLILIGACNSLQFTAMNTVTLIDLDNRDASSGNSLLSVVVQLAMGLGVASAAALLSGFSRELGDNGHVLEAFQATYLCVGLLSMLAAAIFLQLDTKDGRSGRNIEVSADE